MTASLPAYKCALCSGTEFRVNTAFGTPSRVIVECKTLTNRGHGLEKCAIAYGKSVAEAFEAISHKSSAQPLTPTKEGIGYEAQGG